MIAEPYQKDGSNIGNPYDCASGFNDPVAMHTKWEPVGTAGANFCTNKLVARSKA